MWRSLDFHRRLQMVHDGLPPRAIDRGETSCCRSGRCCWTGSCELSPADVAPIAAHLGISPDALFRDYLVVDDRISEDGLRVMPRRAQQTGGHFLSDAETYDVDAACVFLTAANECRIHAVKPAGGAHYQCWNEDTHGSPPGCVWTEDQVRALGWDGDRWGDEPLDGDRYSGDDAVEEGIDE